MKLVSILESKCKQSYACVHICPVKALGFSYVTEAAFAIDLVARKYFELFTDLKGNIISHLAVLLSSR